MDTCPASLLERHLPATPRFNRNAGFSLHFPEHVPFEVIVGIHGLSHTFSQVQVIKQASG